MAIAGKVAITPGYEWSVDVAYDKLVVVTFGNNVYLSIKPNTGIEPTNEEFWMLLVENVTQEQYESIINGTTQVGNAKKLNGLTDADFQKTKAVDADTNTLASLYDLVPNSGKARFMYIASVPSDFPTNLGTLIDKGYLSVEVNKIGNLAYYNINAVYPNGTPFNITGYYTGSVFYWNNNADGGNADTVDEYHATDLMSTMKYLEINDKTGTYDLFSDTYNNRIVQIFATGANVSNLPPTLLTDDGYGDGIIHGWMVTFSIGNYSRKIFLSLRSAKTYECRESNGTWLSWNTNFTSAGGMLTGDVQIAKSTYPTIVKLINCNGNAFLRNYTDDDNYMDLLINSNGLNYVKRANGAGVTYQLLHTGNKPTGSYTGNGDATERTIDLGGIVNACIIEGPSGCGIVFSRGGIFTQSGANVSVGIGAASVRITDNKLIIASSDGMLNADGQSYYYKVL